MTKKKTGKVVWSRVGVTGLVGSVGAAAGDPHPLSGDQFARSVLAILKWNWLEEDLSVEARRVLPLLLLELYLAKKTGKRISKKQACDIMGVDYAKTGPKYVAQAVAKGLIAIDAKPAEDRRKDFLRATAELEKLLSHELDLLSNTLSHELGREQQGIGERLATLSEGYKQQFNRPLNPRRADPKKLSRAE